jgi:hypothetical protein
MVEIQCNARGGLESTLTAHYDQDEMGPPEVLREGRGE